LERRRTALTRNDPAVVVGLEIHAAAPNDDAALALIAAATGMTPEPWRAMMAAVVREPVRVARVTASRVATRDAVRLTTASTGKAPTPDPAIQPPIPKEDDMDAVIVAATGKAPEMEARIEESIWSVDEAVLAKAASMLFEAVKDDLRMASAGKLDGFVHRMVAPTGKEPGWAVLNTAARAKDEELERLMAAFRATDPA